jgi:hypothetical protein
MARAAFIRDARNKPPNSAHCIRQFTINRIPLFRQRRSPSVQKRLCVNSHRRSPTQPSAPPLSSASPREVPFNNSKPSILFPNLVDFSPFRPLIYMSDRKLEEPNTFELIETERRVREVHRIPLPAHLLGPSQVGPRMARPSSRRLPRHARRRPKTVHKFAHIKPSKND